jgi:DNA invertase Pin-like site-specific DNA recombinase
MRHDPAPTNETSPPRPVRCAVYARVSVDDRQDSEMPSVEVQGQACRAYIDAHRHEHWQAIESAYEDSGYSGGDLQRPALRRLLDDMQSDKVDVVVVHRLDRLSRSVQDLCILLPLFTIPGIRLVSVTQPLDTGTPEGRLNLHLLTSFAQFERDLIGERTREKLSATRAKGLWQGNGAPLGYRVDHQQRLVVVDAEAGMVRDIFRRFLDLGAMSSLVEFLQKRGYKTRHWVTRDGKKRGGQLFDRNAVYRLLNNRILIGEVYYDGEWHRGQHTPIVDLELWDQVHAVLAQRARRKGVPSKGRDSLDFPLAGRLFWQDGRAFTCFESSPRHGRRYRYYIAPSGGEAAVDGVAPVNLATVELHKAVIHHLREQFRDPHVLSAGLLAEHRDDADFDEARIIDALNRLDAAWHLFIDKTQAHLVLSLVDRVTLQPDGMVIRWNLAGLAKLVR